MAKVDDDVVCSSIDILKLSCSSLTVAVGNIQNDREDVASCARLRLPSTPATKASRVCCSSSRELTTTARSISWESAVLASDLTLTGKFVGQLCATSTGKVMDLLVRESVTHLL